MGLPKHRETFTGSNSPVQVDKLDQGRKGD